MISEVLTKILPQSLGYALGKLNADKLCEVRLRSGGAVSVNYGGQYRYIGTNGVTDNFADALSVSAEEVRQTMIRACDKSLYAVNDRICRGYLTLAGGVRIGIAGETVTENSEVKTVKNFTGLNIRIPHEIVGCGEKIIKDLRAPAGYYSTLIISPPGAGKTTLLRDLTRIVSSDKHIYNVMIVDEREEIAAVSGGKPSLDVGRNSDVISACSKEYAFINSLRAMRPDIIVTDELCDESDTFAVENAIGSGVCVFASVHADSHLRLKEKPAFASLLRNKSFGRYVDMSTFCGVGTVEGIYDEDFRPITQRSYL